MGGRGLHFLSANQVDMVIS